MNAESTLWVIHGRKPVLWSVPFRVRWVGKEATVTAAVHLNVTQARAVTEHLATFARRDGPNWVLSYTALKDHGEPAPGDGNPEEYLGWERMKAAGRKPFKPLEDDPERREFLDWVFQHGLLYPFASRRPEVEWLWNQFCHAALNWLINEEKPVDLYFIKLHNWPWRLDWKQKIRRNATLYGIERTDRRLRHCDSPSLEEIRDNECIRTEATNGHLSHMIDPFVCGRFVEVEHTRAWWRQIKRVEQERWKMLKAEGYAASFLSSTRRQWPIFVRVLHNWMANCLHPSARILESSLGCRYRLVPRLRGMLVGGKIKRSNQTALQAAVHALRGRKRKKLQSSRTLKSLRPVPPVSKGPADVRPGGHDVLEPQKPADGG